MTSNREIDPIVGVTLWLTYTERDNLHRAAEDWGVSPHEYARHLVVTGMVRETVEVCETAENVEAMIEAAVARAVLAERDRLKNESDKLRQARLHQPRGHVERHRRDELTMSIPDDRAMVEEILLSVPQDAAAIPGLVAVAFVLLAQRDEARTAIANVTALCDQAERNYGGSPGMANIEAWVHLGSLRQAIASAKTPDSLGEHDE